MKTRFREGPRPNLMELTVLSEDHLAKVLPATEGVAIDLGDARCDDEALDALRLKHSLGNRLNAIW